jgi:hypothetical protein
VFVIFYCAAAVCLFIWKFTKQEAEETRHELTPALAELMFDLNSAG